ncbi:hypothetical protein HFO61_03910 [Rhizobium leguminosarum]|uniref:GNAT family N-acetyltransferase n=1 Tax=Rhizobium leguminosarum TaxID=384 RepID=UPI001C96BA7D|nr:GNAT family N-acetyltransferase [Rhizobium leguminosarum]MBY5545993.1 hypothetical protein [Rhizobium leguminosarum]
MDEQLPASHLASSCACYLLAVVAAERMRTTFRQDKRDDPVAAREFKKLTKQMVKVIDEREDAVRAIASGRELNVSTGNISEELTEDDFKKALDSAVREVYDREQRKMYAIVCKSPSKCSDKEIDSFCLLVAEGGEVSQGLNARVKRAQLLGFVVHKDVIIGTAALKNPAVSYRAKVFKDAKSPVEPTTFPYELGWIYLHRGHRGKGQMADLLKELSTFSEKKNVFATTRTNNERMKKALLKLDFKSNGHPYASRQHSDETLELFLRAGDLKGS